MPSNTADSPPSPTNINISVELTGDTKTDETQAQSSPSSPSSLDPTELEFPSNSYYCGTSKDTAASSCSNACPSGKDNECPGNLMCFGETECMNKESFFCGSSWLDASDKCSKPCPSGDAIECDNGEACFAWTSCENTHSYYCGASFDDANNNCVMPCPSRSSLDCPGNQGCFAYTTCERTEEGPHATDPSNMPLNDYFCGENKELASATCSVACQSGEDSECPGNMMCFENTGCSARDSFWCGNNWLEAAEQCSKPCSSGSSIECDGGQSCFAHTGCQTNLFYCGSTFEDASETCSNPCEGRSSNECGPEEYCFAFVTDCADESSQGLSIADPQSMSMGIANTNFNFDNPPANNGDPEATNWRSSTSWEEDWIKSSKSSSAMRMTSCMLGSITLLLSALL